MRFPVIHISFLPIAGIALFPFILVKKVEYKGHETFINHEKIHLAQQLELLLLGFYILYLLHYFYNLLKYLNHDKAYMNIIFEKEAYTMEREPEYLHKRKFCEWLRFL
ncbi:MAG: hypothetical protein H7Y13_00160 [Sphingobacteriaceae bacterium]|nr:hypothetical protein [Sphingobacteriaceae bacterium]